jgi:hypothetical protein
MKYIRQAHLIYAVVFALFNSTVLKLGTGSTFHAALAFVLGLWLLSAVGVMFWKKWAWASSVVCMSLLWLLVAANLTAAIRTHPFHSDWLKDILLVVVLTIFPLTVGLCGLIKTRKQYSEQKPEAIQMPTNAGRVR